MPARHIRAVLYLLVLFVLAPLACGTPPAATRQPRKVTLRLQWLPQTQFAGYYVAREKGFYREVGLDVNIEEGAYGKNNLATVADGIEEFGTKWLLDLMPEIGRIKLLANICKENGLLFVSRRSSGIRRVEDFPGHRVSVWFTGNEFQLFTLLEKARVSRESVRIVAQHFDLTQFLKKEVDVTAAMTYNELHELERRGLPADDLNLIRSEDYGITFLGDSIFTSREFYRTNPKLCADFVLASVRGWEYAIRYPEEATRIVIKNNPKARLEYGAQIQQLQSIIKLIRAEKWPIGHIDRQMVDEGFAIARRFGIIKEIPARIEDTFTNIVGRQPR